MTNKEILKEIKYDHYDDGLYDGGYTYDDSEYLEEVCQDDWTQNHKSQYRESIYWSTKHNVHVAVNEQRQGSYHTDWYYGPPNVYLVEKVEKEVTRIETTWVAL